MHRAPSVPRPPPKTAHLNRRPPAVRHPVGLARPGGSVPLEPVKDEVVSFVSDRIVDTDAIDKVSAIDDASARRADPGTGAEDSGAGALSGRGAGGRGRRGGRRRGG
jgi:hypothetical protein